MATKRKNNDWEAYLPDGATIRMTGYVKRFSGAGREKRFHTLYRDGITIREYIADGMRQGLANSRSSLRQDIRWDSNPKNSGGRAMIEVWLPDGTKLDPETLPKRQISV